MRNLDDLFAALAKSTFRHSFHLRGKELAYPQSKGLAIVLTHAEDFIAKRLAPAAIPNDGKQTPFLGHPVFVAQHATACCCRGAWKNDIAYRTGASLHWKKKRMSCQCWSGGFGRKENIITRSEKTRLPLCLSGNISAST